ncbi:hypothetical protein ACFL2Q_08165 [Thermodesulfobacteriota bacterium]
MVARKKSKDQTIRRPEPSDLLKTTECDEETANESELLERVRDMIGAGLTPASALKLLGQLVAETPSASKEALERIKMIDKIVNTARAMMETKLKNEDTDTIIKRLDEMESLVEKLATETRQEDTQRHELWRRGRNDE